MTLVVSGASGLVGRALAKAAAGRGELVRRLVRRAPTAADEFAWDPGRGECDPEAFRGCRAVVHLAGENIAGGRWTAARRRRVVDSRVLGTRLVAAATAAESAAAAASGQPAPVLVCASAVGYYGDRGEEELDESSPAGTGFLAETCAAWEAASAAAADAGVRVVLLRHGVVLSPEGGALRKMLPAYRLGLGGRLGSGRQWMPWLGLADAVAMIEHAIQAEELRGPVNAVVGSVRNADFSRALGRALRRPAVVPAPAPVLRLLFGQMAEEMVLGGQRVVPGRLEGSGYRAVEPGLEVMLRKLA